MRKGEVRALRWSDIDFEKGLIHIKRHVNDKKIRRNSATDDNMIVGRKNGGELILMMDKNTERILNSLIKDEEWRLENKEKYVFGGSKPVGPYEPNRHLNQVASLAGLNRIKVHGLRHSHVSFLISKGLNVYEIANRIGDSVEMVLNVYGHMFPNPQKNVVRALDENFDFQITEIDV